MFWKLVFYLISFYFLMGCQERVHIVKADDSKYGFAEKVNSRNFLANFDNDSAIQSQLELFYKTRFNRVVFEPTIEGEEELFFDDVYEDFRQHCTPCHNGTGQAPFSFNDYGSIRRKGKSIRQSLVEKIMPPWPSGIEGGVFCNEQVISDEVRSRMIRWIDQGCKLSSNNEWVEQTLSPLPKYETDTLYLKAPVVYTLSKDSDIYVSTVYNPELTNDIYVNSIEFNSSAADMVHHYTLYMDTLGILPDTGISWGLFQRPFDAECLIKIDTWTKGIRPVIFNENLAYRVPKDARFLIDTHYSGYGNRGRSESADLVLHLTSKPRYQVNWEVVFTRDLDLAANEVTTRTLTYKIDTAISLLGIFPHAHYIARTVNVFAVNVDGSVDSVVYIDSWDYLLQTKYMLRTPIYLAKGATLVMNVVYDNTDKNPNQPNNPVQDIHYGHTGSDEMLVLTMYYTHERLDNMQQCSTRILQ